MGIGVGYVHYCFTDLRGVAIAAFLAKETRPVDVFHGRNWVREDHGFKRQQIEH